MTLGPSSIPDQPVAPLPIERACPFDPPIEYRDLRARPGLPLVRTPKGDLAWLVTRFDDVRAVLADKRFSSSPLSPGYPSYIAGNVPPPPGFFMQWDDPEHSRLRMLVVREFLAKHIEALHPRMQAIVDAALDDFLRREAPADLVAGFAYPVAFRNICGLVGVPSEDQEFLQNTVDAILDRAKSGAESERAAMALMGYFDRVVTAKEAAPADDLVGRLVVGARREGRLTHAELVGVTALLLLGGYDTMVQVIGLGVMTLLDHPEQKAEFLADPALGEPLVDELVRYLTVNHAGLPRAALEDVEVGGQLVRAGEGLLVVLNAGNRDATAFERPDCFDLHRDARRHLGFGHGIHKCIGSPFAKAELPIVFRKLFTRAPDLRLAVPAETLSFRDEMVLYGVRALPVAW